MLGGYGHVSDGDQASSIEYIEGLKLDKAGVALDVGAGIGRVSKHVLLKTFAKVPAHFATVAVCSDFPCALVGWQCDMLEADKGFAEKARSFVDNENLENIFVMGMEEFTPENKRYALIWIQWCIIYLTDDVLVAFLQRCAEGLAPGGVIGIKDNVCPPAMGFEVDNTDNSVTRSDAHYKKLFARAGLNLIRDEVQKNLPKELFQVRMYTLSKEAADKENQPAKKAKNAPAVIE